MIDYRHPYLIRLYALGWSALITLLLVQSSTQPVIGPAAPPGAPHPGREFLLNSAHLVAFSVMVFLWWWAFIQNTPHLRAVLMALSIALILGGITEVAQGLVPDREVSLLDLAMNWGSSLAVAWYLYRITRNRPAAKG